MGPGLYISNKFPSMSYEHQSLRTIFLENKVQLLSHTSRCPQWPQPARYSCLHQPWHGNDVVSETAPLPISMAQPSSTQHKGDVQEVLTQLLPARYPTLTHLCILDTQLPALFFFEISFLFFPSYAYWSFILSLNIVSSVTTPISLLCDLPHFFILFTYTFPSLKGKLHEDLRLSHSFCFYFSLSFFR